MRARLLAVMVSLLATVASLTVTAGPAQAAAPTPPLVALTVLPTALTPPGQPTIAWRLDDPRHEVTQVVVFFAGTYSTGQAYRKIVPTTYEATPAVGSRTMTLGQGVPNGTLRITAVTVQTRLHTSRYLPDGTVTHDDGTTGQHTLDLPAQSITVSDSEEDTVAPRLLSEPTLDFATSPRRLTIGWASEDAHPSSLELTLVRDGDPADDERFTVTVPTTTASGSATVPAASGWPDGRLVLHSVTLIDSAANRSTYLSDRTVSASPAYAGRDTTHDLDLRASGFTVTGSPRASTAPVLEYLGVTSGTVYHGKASLITGIRVSAGSSPATVSLDWAELDGTRPASMTDIEVPRGRQALALGSVASTSGRLRLESVTVADALGQYAVYHRDGTVTGRFPASTRHGLGLPRADWSGQDTPGYFEVTATAHDGGATIRWTTPEDHGVPVTGYRVTTTPRGTTSTLPASARSVRLDALPNDVQQQVTVLPLTEAVQGYEQSVSVTPRDATRIFALDADRNGTTDVMAVDPSGRLLLWRGNGRGGFAGSATTAGTGFSGFRSLVARRSHHRDPVMLVGSDAQGALHGFTLTADGRAAGSPPFGELDRDTRLVLTPGDTSGDLQGDLLTVQDDGRLRYRRSSPSSWYLTPPSTIGTGWGTTRSAFGAGDFSGDGRDDMLVVRSDGTLWLYAQTGTPRWSARKIGQGWGSFRSVFSGGDFSGDGRPDVMAIDQSGALWLYRGNGVGGFSGGGTRIGTGWAGLA